jgi:hypothetical protein
MKRLGFQVDHSKFFIGHFAANRITAAVQPTSDTDIESISFSAEFFTTKVF